MKLSTLRFPKRRNEWSLGRWAAKCLVHSIPAYRQYGLNEIEIKNTPEGSPYIHPIGGEVSPECLSISHCEPFALVAISLDTTFRIGADLEKIEARSNIFLEDYFTEKELDVVDSCPAANRTMLINLIWSTKEAMLKAVGTGLRRDTRSVEIFQVDGSPSADGKWHELGVKERECSQRKWVAWGQRRGDFVIVLAGFTTLQTGDPVLNLVEK